MIHFRTPVVSNQYHFVHLLMYSERAANVLTPTAFHTDTAPTSQLV